MGVLALTKAQNRPVLFQLNRPLGTAVTRTHTYARTHACTHAHARTHTHTQTHTHKKQTTSLKGCSKCVKNKINKRRRKLVRLILLRVIIAGFRFAMLRMQHKGKHSCSPSHANGKACFPSARIQHLVPGHCQSGMQSDLYIYIVQKTAM